MKTTPCEKCGKPVEKPIKPIIEKDERSNVIHCKDSDGYECWREFDNEKVTNSLTKYSEERWELNGEKMVVKKQ